MLGFKPNARIWKRVNRAILNENAGVVLVTLISGICSLLVDAKVSPNERSARVHLAAMLLSPDDGPVGSLVPQLQAELKRLNDGKWMQ
jgi:hypothetical protein